MTVAPLIAMKSTKCESLEAVGKELDRRASRWVNGAIGDYGAAWSAKQI